MNLQNIVSKILCILLALVCSMSIGMRCGDTITQQFYGFVLAWMMFVLGILLLTEVVKDDT